MTASSTDRFSAARPVPKAGILDIAQYVGGKSKVDGVEHPIKLSSNENILGCSEAASAAYAEAAARLHMYPDGKAAILREAGATMVWCGDHSLDRGSGSVPAYLAAELGLAQALGLVEVEVAAGAALTGLRRLDRGRRERLALDGDGVISVEGATAQLRRASLAAARSARTATIDRVGLEPLDHGAHQR